MTLEIANALRSKQALVKILVKGISFNIARRKAAVLDISYTSTASFRTLEISVNVDLWREKTPQTSKSLHLLS